MLLHCSSLALLASPAASVLRGAWRRLLLTCRGRIGQCRDGCDASGPAFNRRCSACDLPINLFWTGRGPRSWVVSCNTIFGPEGAMAVIPSVGFFASFFCWKASRIMRQMQRLALTWSRVLRCLKPQCVLLEQPVKFVGDAHCLRQFALLINRRQD